ncbi:ABC transporter permease [Flagellimonas allohymeniacidonis]|uniref:ABC transporter permease n=1 Tax=Flagellimonas allohymeniacidonis TaxID=2517819 RepID=A0A4Q8QEQ3_9FLAO|nr:ABC transporter permease [Allomuricauda hymeniacidonis]TAI47658.1 ABC transporter permease [Allomuricauda hymeniacidonis]
MIRNYLHIAWRSLKKDSLFAFIKIGGFAIGIAACLLITLFINDELSYDKHYADSERTYRVISEIPINGEVLKNVYFQLPLADVLESDFPEVEKAGKYNSSELFGAGKKTIQPYGETKSVIEDGFVFVSQPMLEILELPFVEGQPENALTDPLSLVISKKKADKLFPKGDALGKTVILDYDTANPYKITGVVDRSSIKSHFDYDYLMHLRDTNFNWVNTNYITYIKVQKNTDIDALKTKMLSVVDKYIIPELNQNEMTKKFVDLYKQAKFDLQPISDIHLKTESKIFDNLKHGDIRFVWLFAAIACFVLLLASINFINLSTAKSANRAKEVGLRKTIGAFRKNLVFQFLTESILLSFISFVLGILLAWAILPWFNTIALKSIGIPWSSPLFYLIALVTALLIGIVAGLYPAFYLSSFKPAKVLKGSLTTGSKNKNLRGGLVVFQFAISIILIIGTLIIYKQMDYILNKELGYNKEQVLVVQGAGVLGDKVDSFKKQLLELPMVSNVSVSDYLPVEGTKRNGNTFKKIDDPTEAVGVPGQVWAIDHDYVKTLGLEITLGRDFSIDRPSDATDAVLINQKMALELELENPIGKRITNGDDWVVVGVVKDFHFASLRDNIAPLALVISNSPDMISVRIGTSDLNESIAAISEIWGRNVGNQAFNYTFLDDDFAKMHDDVRRMGNIFNGFALFAILVACLGLFALSAFMVEQRQKEISIRLVLGAPFKSIYKLLTVDFLRLILIAVVIAIPVGWFAMQRWLEDFAYRISLDWTIFLLAGAIALAVALVTISYQSVSAALIQPLKSLRNE